MVRVLCLLDAGPDYQTETGVRQLAARDASGAVQVETRTIGRGGTYSTAFSALLHLRLDRAIDRFDVVHAWGGRALLVAALASARPIVFSPDRFPTPRTARWMRSVMAVRDLHVVAATDTARRALVTRGVPVERCHLIRPAVDFAQVKRRRDDALRARLGFARDDYVILACGESTRDSAHALAVWAASILHVLDPKYRLLLWGRGPLSAQAVRFAHRTHQHGLMEVAEHELKRPVRFEELLGATDAVLVTATGPASTLPIAVCMAAALPIVALVTPPVAELLEDRHTALMVGKSKPRLIAQRVLDLRKDPSLQWTISDMARTEAYEYFSLTRFLNQHRAIYRQLASGQRVDVPQQAPGAGLRFHGRA
jgi:glycosyltransferase involved in cell wall biosynthesis